MKSVLTLLSEKEIEAIHNASVRILEQGGALVRSPRALKVLADAGAKIDTEKKLVRVPSSLVKECLRKHPTSFTLSGRIRRNDLPITPDRMYAHNGGGCLNILDANSGKARTATAKDVEVLSKLLDALDNIHQCTTLIYVSDAPPEVRGIHTSVNLLRNTTKNCVFTPYNVSNLEVIVRLAATIVGGKDELRKTPLIQFGISPTSPLELSEDVADQLMKAAAYNLPVAILPCPLAGGTSPATLAGTLVQQNVEFLVSHVIVQLVNPGNSVFYSGRAMSMDMRTGVSAMGVEFGLMSAATVQLARYYNLPSDVYGLATNSKSVDEQTALEKTAVGLLPALAGANFLSGAGSLEMGMTASPEQLVIDNEILQIIFRASRGIDVSSETLAADLIEEIGPGGHYLGTEHTRKFYLHEHYVPQLSDRSVRADWEKAGSKEMVKRAGERVDKILKEHSVEPLDRDVEKELEKIVAEADKELAR